MTEEKNGTPTEEPLPEPEAGEAAAETAETAERGKEGPTAKKGRKSKKSSKRRKVEDKADATVGSLGEEKAEGENGEIEGRNGEIEVEGRNGEIAAENGAPEAQGENSEIAAENGEIEVETGEDAEPERMGEDLAADAGVEPTDEEPAPVGADAVVDVGGDPVAMPLGEDVGAAVDPETLGIPEALGIANEEFGGEDVANDDADTDSNDGEGSDEDEDNDDGEFTGEVSRDHLKGLLEALIFASDRPLKPSELSKLAAAPQKEVKLLLGVLRQDYLPRGIKLGEVAGGFVFHTDPVYAPFVRDMTKQKPVKLSRPQIETLAILAYRQPITRPEIDEIRGVDCGAVLKLLLERDLIRILGKKDEPGRPLLYGTTPVFLEFFGLKSLKDLPTLHEFTELNEESRRVVERELGEIMEVAAPIPQPDPPAGGEGAADPEAFTPSEIEPEPEDAPTIDAPAMPADDLDPEDLPEPTDDLDPEDLPEPTDDLDPEDPAESDVLKLEDLLELEDLADLDDLPNLKDLPNAEAPPPKVGADDPSMPRGNETNETVGSGDPQETPASSEEDDDHSSSAGSE